MTLKNLCLIAALLLANLYISFGAICQLNEPCPVAFKSRGCFNDNEGNRVLPNYIYNERDPSTSSYGGRTIDWWHWEDYLAGFTCRCAKKAKELGYDLFGFQFYGECWAGNSNTSNYKTNGKSVNCVGDYYKSCATNDRYCTGKQSTNFVYQIVDNTCSLQFERVGCYRDKHVTGARPLGDYVLNDRDSTANESYSGQNIDWVNYDVYLPDFACRCAKKAQQEGAKYFGLQYYGECWTSVNGSDTYFIDGKSDAGSCVDNCYKTCQARENEICIGAQFANYVYRIKSASEPACDIAIESIGCYNENTNDRALKTELVNTNPGTGNFYGAMPLKGEWNTFFPKYLCKCAREAKIKGWTYFGVSKDACYSDATSENYNNHGVASFCGEGSTNNTCGEDSKLCSGSNTETNYIYKISTSSSNPKRSFIKAKDPFVKRFWDFEI